MHRFLRLAPRGLRPCLAACALALLAACQSLPAPPADGRVEVVFQDADKFTELRDAPLSARKREEGALEELRKYIALRATQRLPEGQRMTVTVTDVKRAGSYEPWLRPGMDDVRIVKDIYPPRIDLQFRIVDASGALLREGVRKLRDPAFMWHANAAQTDGLAYEKALIDDWLAQEFSRSRG